MNPTKPPESLGQKRPHKITGTPGDTTAARRPPSPPPHRAGTGREPAGRQPTWLADKINLSRRAAHPGTCPTCSANVLVGPDHDTCALTVRVDPTPVDPVHEVAALLAGRTSYDHDRGELHYRAPEHHHSPRRPHPVVLEHTCTEHPTQTEMF